MKYAILILLIALTSCNIPDVVIDAQDELAMEFDRGHCEATHYFSTFEGKYDIPPLTSDWSIHHFLSTFSIPKVWTEGDSSGYPVDYEDKCCVAVYFIWYAEYDYTRFTSYHFGVIQAMKDWR